MGLVLWICLYCWLGPLGLLGFGVGLVCGVFAFAGFDCFRLCFSLLVVGGFCFVAFAVCFGFYNGVTIFGCCCCGLACRLNVGLLIVVRVVCW